MIAKIDLTHPEKPETITLGHDPAAQQLNSISQLHRNRSMLPGKDDNKIQNRLKDFQEYNLSNMDNYISPGKKRWTEPSDGRRERGRDQTDILNQIHLPSRSSFLTANMVVDRKGSKYVSVGG